MSAKDAVDSTREFEEDLRSAADQKYLLRLYVSGMTLKSMNAVENVKRVCEATMAGRYELEVVDIRQHPEFAREAQVVAAPTLVKQLPLPLRRLIGDMSNTGRVLVGLDIAEKGSGKAKTEKKKSSKL
jgi:circadian clock protein KaiB